MNPFLILGNPENRRVTAFRDALQRRGQPEPIVVSWADFAQDASVLAHAAPDIPLHFRIDSPGENKAVEQVFLELGYDGAQREGLRALSELPPPSHGRILAPRQQHLGFLALLDRIDTVLQARPSVYEWEIERLLSLPLLPSSLPLLPPGEGGRARAAG